MKPDKRYQIKVTGKVQGVWFRKYTKDKADELGLKGFVKNLPDGSVYTEVEGIDEKSIREFLEWLHTGSPLSRVDTVKIVSEDKPAGFTGFDIDRS